MNEINIIFGGVLVFIMIAIERNKFQFQSRLARHILLGIMLNVLALSNLFAQASNDTLYFLGNKNIAPVIYLEDSIPRGVAVDIVRTLAKHIPQPVKIIAMDWKEAQTIVARGEADALIQINQTEERLKIYDFSDALLESQFSIFVRSDRVGISGISSLRGLKVGVEAGGLPRQLLDENPDIPLTIIPNFLEGFKLLNKGTIDAVVVDYRVGAYILAENNIRNIKVSGEPIAFSYSAIAVKKGNSNLLNAINHAFRIIKADGTYQKILDKWKPKETVFYTREQITKLIYNAAFIASVVLLIIVAFWILSLRKQLTKRKAAEEKLRGQFSTLRGIIDSANALIFSIDRQYCYTSFNNGHAAVMKMIYGAEIENNHNILDYMTVPEDRETAKRNLDRALTGEQLVEEAYSGEGLRERKYFQVEHSPIKNEEGETIGVAVLAQDITERKQAEEAIRKSEARYYDLFEDSPISLWEEDFSDVKRFVDELRDSGVSDFRDYFNEHPEDVIRCVKVTKIITVNKATLKLFKADSKERLLERLNIIFTKESLDVFKEELLALAAGSTLFHSEVVQKNLAGEKIHAELKLSIAPGYKNTWGKIFVSLSDMTERKRIEEVLETERKRMEIILSALNTGLSLINPDMTIAWVNLKIREMFPGKEPLGQLCHLFYESRETVCEGCGTIQAFVSGKVCESEQLVPSTDKWYNIISLPIIDEAGNIMNVLEGITDITERKQVEEDLRNTVARINEAQRTAHIGSWELNLTKDVLLWSDEIYRIFEIDSGKFGASYEAFLDAIHPDDREAVNIAYTNSLKTKTPYMIDHRLLFPDGQIKYVHEQCETFYDEFGNPYRSMGTVQDITDRKLTEEALLKSEAGLREAQRLGRLGSWDWDAITDVITWSDEYYRIYGFDPSQKPPGYEEHLKAYTPESAERLDAAVKKNMETGEPYELDLELTQTSGQHRWITARSETKRNADGQIDGLRGTAQDITDRKIMEEEIRKLNQELEQRVANRTAQLELANKELEAFAYSVSHDLRAPLRHIDGFLEMLKERIEAGLDAESRHFMDTISKSAKLMGTLIDDLLSFSRMGRFEISNSLVDFNKLVQDVIMELKPETEDRNIKWQIADLPVVTGDRSMLRIVLINLISNALKFTRPRQPAEIEIGELPGNGVETVVFVRDNGVGFDMTYADGLFGVFQRLHRADEFEGTGIGLANVKRIINRHGGNVWAESIVNKGARFYFSLPKMIKGK